MKKLLASIVLAIFFMASIPTPALAMAEPDSVTLYDIEIFQGILVTDDFLAIVPYNIPFAVPPDEYITETFIFRLMSPDGATENGTMLAYPRYEGGYGKGVVSFYFEEGMVWNSAYIFRVQENPAFYPAAQYWDFPVGVSNYSSDTSQEDALRAKILDSASELSTEYTVDLLSTSDSGQAVLTTYGELYYLYAVPGIQTMCPSLFSVQIEAPTYTKRSWSMTLADSLKTKYNGTVIGDFMTGYAGLFSMDTTAAMNVLSIILFAALIIIAIWKFKATTLSAFTDGYALLLVLMLDGMFSMVLAGLFAFLAAFLGGVIWFLNKS